MKKLYTLTLAAAVALSSAALTPKELKAKAHFPNPAKSGIVEKDRTAKKSSAATPHRAPAFREAAAGKWLPQTYTTYINEGEWVEESKVTTTYDAEGRLASELIENYFDESFDKAEYIYGENGAITVMDYVGDSEDKLSLSSKWIREYDPEAPGLVIKSERFSYDEATGRWEPYFTNYIREVTRDDKGNITLVTYSTFYMDEYTPVQKVEVTYGADGLPATITESQLSYDDNMQEYWQKGTSYYDCQWYKCDGQVYDLDCIFDGGNKIKSYSQSSEDYYVGAMTVEYVGDTDDFTCKADYGAGITSTQVWTNYPYGGYQSYISFILADEETQEVYSTQAVVEGEEYNQVGNVTFTYAYEEYDGEIELYDWQVGESTLNENGMPQTYTLSIFEQSYEDDDWGGWGDDDFMLAPALSRGDALVLDPANPPVDGEWMEAYRTEYDSYVYVTNTGVDNVKTDADAPAEYYNLQGIRVERTTSGLYIKRQGSSVSKQIFK